MTNIQWPWKKLKHGIPAFSLPKIVPLAEEPEVIEYAKRHNIDIRPNGITTRMFIIELCRLVNNLEKKHER